MTLQSHTLQQGGCMSGRGRAVHLLQVGRAPAACLLWLPGGPCVYLVHQGWPCSSVALHKCGRPCIGVAQADIEHLALSVILSLGVPPYAALPQCWLCTAYTVAHPLQLKPGLSSYPDDPQKAAESLQPLLDKALATVPASLQVRCLFQCISCKVWLARDRWPCMTWARLLPMACSTDANGARGFHAVTTLGSVQTTMVPPHWAVCRCPLLALLA